MDLFQIIYKIITPDIVRVVLVVQALILGSGGIMGFLKAHSKQSLIAGVSSAVVLLACTGLTFLNFTFATILAAIISDLLAAVFAYRMSKTKKFMPSGMLMLFCILAGTYFILVFVTPMISAPGKSTPGGGGGGGLIQEIY